MNRADVAAALRRALEISRELATVADSGDARQAASLDLERLQLLKSVRRDQPMDEKDRAVLNEIAELNAASIGRLEHRFRAKCRDLDMLSVGQRALRAYSTTRQQR